MRGRFEGRMKVMNKDRGIAFIECPETRRVFERDIFVDINRLPGEVEKIGDWVSFELVVGRRGYPEAASCKAA